MLGLDVIVLNAKIRENIVTWLIAWLILVLLLTDYYQGTCFLEKEKNTEERKNFFLFSAFFLDNKGLCGLWPLDP